MAIPPNVITIRTFDEFRAIRDASNTAIICLQANYWKVDDRMDVPDTLALEDNVELFMEMADTNPDIDFGLVTHDGRCYWTFYNGENWTNKSFYDEPMDQINFDRHFIEQKARAVGVQI